jgi:hypothetical protein
MFQRGTSAKMNVEIAQKLLRNCSEITQKLLRNYSEITQKLLRNYSEIGMEIAVTTVSKVRYTLMFGSPADKKRVARTK